MAQSYTPFIIQIDLRANLEDCPDVIPVIRRKLMRSAFDGKDGPMRLTFVKSETGAATTILEKFRDIADHPDVTRLRVRKLGLGLQNTGGSITVNTVE
jgi:hypothetical protein